MEEFKFSNRRSFIKKIVFGSLSITFLNSFTFLKKRDKIKKITILHTNDIHSHIDSFPEKHSKYGGRGGIRRIASLIKKIRSKEENVLLIDAGDIFQGTPYFNKFKGSLELKIMSQMGYLASTMGNHDFDNGLNGFENVLHHANFPFICSNYDFSETILKNKTVKFLINEIDGIKIGFFGLGIKLEGLVDKKCFENTKYLDPVKTSEYWAEELKIKKKCDLVVCISHLGHYYNDGKISDILLAKQSKHIDVIIGGHTHTFLNKAKFIKNIENNNVIVNQAGWGALALGRIDLKFTNRNKRIDELSSNEILKKNNAKI